jgi:hypothetical protein
MGSYELHEGVKGNGETKWMVVLVENGSWGFIHEFQTKTEAVNWMKWA